MKSAVTITKPAVSGVPEATERAFRAYREPGTAMAIERLSKGVTLGSGVAHAVQFDVIVLAQKLVHARF